MTAPARVWPDPEEAMQDILAPLVTNPATQIGRIFDDVLPYFRVILLGGSDDRVTDTVRVDVDTFAAGYKAASDLAEKARQLLIAPGGHRTPAGARIDDVRTLQRPQELIWGVGYGAFVRFAATYEMTARRITVPVP